MRIKFFPFFTIKQYERGITERLGKFHRFATPGFHIQIPGYFGSFCASIIGLICASDFGSNCATFGHELM
ncbi:hypothetical protein, partial [Carboxylicivirga caseinilyticus]|uniref:hypothetical protein n=1 Tax=Carboxylicivirga caseinilyticus TaxID=3417572 RepID=UPI003D342CB2|nr:hypothetical protein [Marinilabiliaceae bacterium A049]